MHFILAEELSPPPPVYAVYCNSKEGDYFINELYFGLLNPANSLDFDIKESFLSKIYFTCWSHLSCLQTTTDFYIFPQ